MRLAAYLFRLSSRWNRLRKVQRIVGYMAEVKPESVLLVGLGAQTSGEANLVERSIANAAPWTVISGLNVKPSLAGDLAGRPYVCCDGRALPFRTAGLDLVVSNAVIEHVGGLAEQRAFAAEHDRVGLNWVITTPNRWFPVESHTRVIVRHWSERWRAREIANGRSTFTRLLDRPEFRAVLPRPAQILGTALSPTLMAIGPSLSKDEG